MALSPREVNQRKAKIGGSCQTLGSIVLIYERTRWTRDGHIRAIDDCSSRKQPACVNFSSKQDVLFLLPRYEQILGIRYSQNHTVSARTTIPVSPSWTSYPLAQHHSRSSSSGYHTPPAPLARQPRTFHSRSPPPLRRHLCS